MADNIIRLRVDSSEYDSKLKKASEGLTRYIEGCRKVGGTLEVVEKDTLQYVRALGRMESSSRTAKGRLGEMTKAFTDLSVQYNHLSSAEKSSPFGKALTASLEQLKARIKESKTELASIGQQIGEAGTSFGGLKVESADLKGVLSGLGGQLGVSSNLLGVVTTGTLGMTAAITGSVAAVVAATKAWMDYNSELERRDTDASVITGTSGQEAQAISDAAKSMADIYGVDFREALNGINTLMQQFGVTSSQAIQLIRDGLQGMLQGDGPKLLQMIQQYAPSFRDAGIAADELVAIIHNSEGGIFTDANMNAIVMGIKNIRLMTKATSDALAQVGINGNEVVRKLSDGTMTIFDALSLVADKIQETGSGSQAAGQVMQQVFGRQGTAAGTNLGKAIATLNLNLEETKTQTGDVGERMADLEQKNERLQAAIREAFGTEGVAAFTDKLKGDLMDALSDVLESADGLKVAIKWLGEQFEEAIDVAANFVKAISGVISVVNEALKPINSTSGAIEGVNSGLRSTDSSPFIKAISSVLSPLKTYNNMLRTTLKLINSARKALNDARNQADHRKKVEDRVSQLLEAEGLQPGKFLNAAAQKRVKEIRAQAEREVTAQEQRQNTPQFVIDLPPEDDYRNYPTVPTAPPQSNKPAKKKTTTRKVARQAVPKTEEQLNTEQINKLSQEYISATDERRAAIRAEIKTLQDRNAEIKELKEEAQGKVSVPIDPDSLKGLNDELTKLKANQDLSKTNEEWTEWQGKIDTVKKKIAEVTEVEQDLSGLSTANISAFASELQKQIGQSVVGSSTFDALSAQLRSTNTLQDLISNAIKNGISPNSLGDMSQVWTKILAGDGMDAALQAMVDKINEKLAELDLPQLNLDSNTGKLVSDGNNMAKSWQRAGQAIQGVGAAMSQIEDPAARVAGTIAQAIASIALGAGEAIAKGGKLGPWGWIAAAATVTATMLSTIATVRSATAHAQGGLIEGGMVGGSNYSGDSVMTRLNSGELVLNRAQQGNLASQLEDRGMGGYNSSYVSGENIYIALNTYMRRRGLGEIAAFKFK